MPRRNRRAAQVTSANDWRWLEELLQTRRTHQVGGRVPVVKLRRSPDPAGLGPLLTPGSAGGTTTHRRSTR